MRSPGVVFDPPVLDEDLRLEQRVELLHGEQLVAQPAAEGLDVRVLPRRARLDVAAAGPGEAAPVAQRVRRELGPVVAADAPGRAPVLGDDPLQPVLADDQPAVLRLLTDRRDDLAAERTRTVNRLHHLFRNLRPGGAPRKLSADEAARLLRGRRATAAPDRVRLQLARELVAELGVLDRRLRANEQQIEHSGPVDQYPTSGHYASYAGVAPLETSSGDVRQHRMNRRGDRQLNRALYIAAFTQSRMPATDGYAYVRRKRSEGKSRREALRCLKRRLTDVVYRQLLADERAPRTAS